MDGEKVKRLETDNLQNSREVPAAHDDTISEDEETEFPGREDGDAELNVLVRNPMEEPVVLATFFKVCDLADLRRFRLVSQQWYGLSLSRWREEMTLLIDDKDIYPRADSDSFTKLEWKHVSELYDKSEWKSLQSKPFRRYSLFNVPFTKNSMTSCRTRSTTSRETRANAFWKRCGPSMRHLKVGLYGPKVVSVDSFWNVIFELTPGLEKLAIFALDLDEAFPNEDEITRNSDRMKEQRNLKSLEISLFEGSFRGIRIQWEELFEHFPNIERLMLKGFPEVGVSALATTLQRLEHKPQIKSLDIGELTCEDPEVRIQLLQSMNLKSERLRIPVKSRFATPNLLPPPLERQRDTLKELVMLRFWTPNSGLQLYSAPFPASIFTSLTKLTLFSGTCRNLQFLLQTPNLTVLHVDVFKTLDTMIQIPNASLFEGVVLSQLVELHFNVIAYDRYVLPANKMNILIKLMPNVMRLKAPLNTPSLRVVCQNWKNLRWLNIANDKLKLGDSAITGLIPGQEIRKPNLTDLTYLHELSIKRADSLTDKSIYSAFLKLPYLHTLNVTMSDKTTDEAFDDLLKRFPESKLKRCSKSRERGRNITAN